MNVGSALIIIGLALAVIGADYWRRAIGRPGIFWRSVLLFVVYWWLINA